MLLTAHVYKKFVTRDNTSSDCLANVAKLWTFACTNFLNGLWGGGTADFCCFSKKIFCYRPFVKPTQDQPFLASEKGLTVEQASG